MVDNINMNNNQPYLFSFKQAITEKLLNILFCSIHENYDEFGNKILNLQQYIASQSDELQRLEISGRSVESIINEIVEFKDKLNTKNRILESTFRQIDDLNLKLLESEKIKSEFLANTSHELRTPLNAIMGFLELIREGLYDSVDEMNEFVEGAIKSAHHLLKLLTNVIDIARIEANKMKINLQEVNLKLLLEGILSSFSQKVKQSGIDLFLDLPDENLSVKGDRDKIEQIFVNLLTNAFKFTPREGRVTIKVREILAKNYILCEVYDTGIGISEEHQKKIFDRFYQIDGSSTREYGGAGLGLSITRSLVELMGGFIGVNSDGINLGSRFHFTLPIYNFDKEYDFNKMLIKDNVQISGDKEKPLILIVEDDYNYRLYISEMLTKNGFSSVGATTADDGFSRVKEYKPKLILLDLALPRRELSDLHSGIDLYELIQNHSEFASIPILLISGHSFELIKMFNENLKINTNNFFEKPVDSHLLLKKIKELLSV